VKIEFKIGDRVTYKPYELAFKMVITNVYVEAGETRYTLKQDEDNPGQGKRIPLCNAIGKNIMESTLYEQN